MVTLAAMEFANGIISLLAQCVRCGNCWSNIPHDRRSVSAAAYWDQRCLSSIIFLYRVSGRLLKGVLIISYFWTCVSGRALPH